MSLFITFEGGEGSGKSSIIAELNKQLKTYGITNIVSTREPGGIKIAEDIRAVLLDKQNTSMDSITEAMLFAAARRQHLVEKIIPALNNNHIVLCDRFIDSSIVYQGIGRGIGVEKILSINSFAIEKFMPNLTFLLDVDPVVGLSRISKNKNREVNRLDLEAIEFHKIIRDGYLMLHNQYPERIILIDAHKSIDEIVQEIFEIIIKKIESSKDV